MPILKSHPKPAIRMTRFKGSYEFAKVSGELRCNAKGHTADGQTTDAHTVGHQDTAGRTTPILDGPRGFGCLECRGIF
jgi:hypothetical protein